MNNKHEAKPIDVEFYDVVENTDCQEADTKKVIKSQKIPLNLIIAVLQNKAKTILNNKEKVKELVTKTLAFCKKLGNISFVKKWVLDIPKLCDMLTDTVNGVYKNIPYSSLVMIAVAIIYAISPFDILHDALPIIGILDDAAILKVVLNTIKNDLDSYTSWKDVQDVA